MPAYAQALSTEVISLSAAESSQFEAQRSEVGLSAIAQDINTNVEVNRQLAEEAAKAGTLSLEDIPFISDLIANEGKVGIGGGIPMSFSVGSVMGSYGVVVHTDF
ncbi:MAG: hypothetical protein AAF716_11185 [Cyanobacteria bacterium P01_D01_bin.1]